MAKAKETVIVDDTVVELDEHRNDLDDTSEDTEKRQEERQKEWGQQFHKWLINAARRQKVVELLLSQEYPGVSKSQNLLTGIPKRIDKDFAQIVVDNVEVWIQLSFVVGCKSVGSPAKLPTAEGLS